MRNIKFRAWDKDTERMLHEVTVSSDNSVNISINKYLEQTEVEEMPSNMDMIEDWCYPSNTELMQYTGLKDKNGKEIYEGDIVEAGNTGADYKKFAVEYGYWEFGEGMAGKSSYGYNFEGWGEGETEVIGNIYEDKEQKLTS